ncbi:hypothetical protein EDB83DRAFT_593568 [Lactarius deliciosus]|nr:hypothetical protein EDB83DRAFT_593568 [Lactarius deliciosus]
MESLLICPHLMALSMSTKADLCLGKGGISALPTIPWSRWRNTCFSVIGVPIHPDQDSASKANVDGTGIPSRRSGTGGNWQKSPVTIS